MNLPYNVGSARTKYKYTIVIKIILIIEIDAGTDQRGSLGDKILLPIAYSLYL